MEILKRRTAPRYVRDEGITSYLLASPVTSRATYLTTSQVEIEPGGEQRVHSHALEQVYYIVEGEGMMTVGDERAHVGPGDCVFVPAGKPHGLKNEGGVLLKYFSAAAPSFNGQELRNLWPLKSEADVENT
jgi:mannose-6-phosphate isomerase-like protein (cupin superfamily)